MTGKFWILGSIILITKPVYSEGSSFQKRKIQELVQYTEQIAKNKIGLGDVWTPPGETQPITWDSSGTTQYFYQKFFEIAIPRDSFGQFKYLEARKKFQFAPKTDENTIDIPELSRRLRRGDLLFWINTHNSIPETRNPPISHVMIYVGKSKSGDLLMVGSGTKGFGHLTKSGGVDLYLFQPNTIMGCIRDFSGNCQINGEFYGHGRPNSKKIPIYE